MRCELCRELVSADLDGELPPDEQSLLRSHLAGCPACTSFAARAADLHRAARVAPAGAVPDLTAAIMAAAPGLDESRRSARRRPAPASVATLLRYVLGVIAGTQLVLALPELFQRATGGDDLHATHHLGGWDLAFAIGLLVVAVQPWRSRGLLPMAAALAGVMVLMAGIDIANGQATGLTEASHLLELAGLVVLWQLARSQPAGLNPLGRGRGTGPDPSFGDRPALGIVPRPTEGGGAQASHTPRTEGERAA